MFNNIRSIFTGLLLIMFVSCNSKGDKIIPAYNNYKFDSTVIDKLPLYDSLASAISENIYLFQKNINKDDAYQAFRYMPTSNEPEVFNKLPPEIDNVIEIYITKLGKNFIYGFDIFKDSSIKIYIKRRKIENSSVEIEENLSYYQEGMNITQRDYPIKDTILNTRWQYWARFDSPGIF